MYSTQACPDTPDVMFAHTAPDVVAHRLALTVHPDNVPEAGENRLTPVKLKLGIARIVTGN